jgi:hypothetical protein
MLFLLQQNRLTIMFPPSSNLFPQFPFSRGFGVPLHSRTFARNSLHCPNKACSPRHDVALPQREHSS